jgi:hypothetical protein
VHRCWPAGGGARDGLRVDQQQEIINAITQQLSGGGGSSGGSSSGGGGSSGGFSVTTGELTGYVRNTRQLADELHKVATHQIHSVRTIADDSFGKIGKETGFAAALDHFADALQRQASGVAKNADTLSDAVAKTARSYRHDDQEIADELLDLLT